MSGHSGAVGKRTETPVSSRDGTGALDRPVNGEHHPLEPAGGGAVDDLLDVLSIFADVQLQPTPAVSGEVVKVGGRTGGEAEDGAEIGRRTVGCQLALRMQGALTPCGCKQDRRG